MDELLRQLNIPQSNDILFIQRELELRQRSLLESQSATADQNEVKELQMIEKALSQLKWIKNAMSFGLSNKIQEEVGDQNTRANEEAKSAEEGSKKDSNERDSHNASSDSETKAILENYDTILAKANDGDMDAQNKLAWMHVKGENAWKDMKRGEYWFEKAAQQGHAKSQLDLGELIYTSKLPKDDPMDGLRWIEKAAAQKNLRAIEILFEDALKQSNMKGIITLCEQYKDVFSDNQLYTLAQLRLAIHYDSFKEEDFSEESKFYKWSQNNKNSSYSADQYYYLGRYYEGRGERTYSFFGKRSYELAVKYGSKYAAVRLAEHTMKKNSELTEEARKECIELYQFAIDLELPLVYRRLYELYGMNRSNEGDIKLANEYLLKACELGDTQANYIMGTNLLKIAKQNKNKATFIQDALFYLEKAADHGHLQAQADILSFHMKDDITYQYPSFPISNEKVARYVHSLLSNHHEETCRSVAKLFFANNTGKIKEYQLTKEEMMEHISKLVANGDAEIEYHFGICTLNGDGVEKNTVEGLKLIESAARKNYAEAIKWLAIYYYDEKIYDKAAYWGSKANDITKDMEVEWRLGLLCYHGWGTEVNYHKAFRLLNGVYSSLYHNRIHAEVYTYLGVMYHLGLGTDIDYEVAEQLLEKAVAMNESYAMVHLGMMYELGNGHYRNIPKAITWYEKAKMGK